MGDSTFYVPGAVFDAQLGNLDGLFMQGTEFGYFGLQGQVRSFNLQRDPHFNGLQYQQADEYADPTRLNQLQGEELRHAAIQNDIQ